MSFCAGSPGALRSWFEDPNRVSCSYLSTRESVVVVELGENTDQDEIRDPCVSI